MAEQKKKSPRNKTLAITDSERILFEKELLIPQKKLSVQEITNRIIWADMINAVEYLPDQFADLMILDPPYNLDKNFNGIKFSSTDHAGYMEYLESWFPKLLRLLKPGASVYLCGDWKCSAAGFLIMEKYLHVRNRIIWQRDKGRGARTNWKNCCEDIWYATRSNDFYFNVEAVKIKRKVIAPYKQDGKPKDWIESEDGKFRMTHPSNFWDDISIPYWSMPENTDHPTQKPEKLLAKLILASSKPGAMVFDPFCGSGTTAVTAKKLGRTFCGIEWNKEYCCWSIARLKKAEKNKKIQGYADGIFWERNSFSEQNPGKQNRKK